MEPRELAIVIPAFNEQKTIGLVVEKVKTYGLPIVVNDCSTDQTQSVAQSAGALVVNHSINLGYDGALATGFETAINQGAKYVITFDADGQHDAALIEKFLKSLSLGNDIVVGIRPKSARLAEKLFSIYTETVFGVKDPLCGMKGYNSQLLKKKGKISSYNSIGTEILLFGLKNKCSFEQIPIPIFERDGVPRFARTLKANYLIFKAMVMGMAL